MIKNKRTAFEFMSPGINLMKTDEEKQKYRRYLINFFSPGVKIKRTVRSRTQAKLRYVKEQRQKLMEELYQLTAREDQLKDDLKQHPLQQCIYVLQSKTFPRGLKIGYGDVSARLRSAGTWGPDLICVYTFTPITMKAKDLEQKLHNALKGCRMYRNREWFNCKLTTIHRLVQQFCSGVAKF